MVGRMVTLRTFQDPAAAALAKSVLDAHGIVCTLADENAHLYSYAVAIRLLVAEDNVEEAARILNSTRTSQGTVETRDD